MKEEEVDMQIIQNKDDYYISSWRAYAESLRHR